MPVPQRIYESTSDPTVNDDNGKAYRAGDTWVNTSTGAVFKMVGGAPAAADWRELSQFDQYDEGPSDVGQILVANVLVTSAQVLALNATPKEIVAAPGSGYYLEFLGAYVFLDYNSAAYVDDAGEDLVFKYENASGAEISNSLDGSLFDETADALAVARPVNAAASVLFTAENKAIVLHLLVGEWITGNSPLKVRCYYRKIRKASLEAIA